MRYLIKRTLKNDLSLVSCVICRKICKGGRSLKSHSTQVHVPKSNKFKKRGKPIGFPAWNKGKISRIILDTRDKTLCGKHGGYRPNAGRSKKFKVLDTYGNVVTLQSSYELNVFEILCELGIEWIRPRALKYDNKNYFADFYLPVYDIWLDPKNEFKAKQDVEKIEKVIKQNDIKLYVLLKHHITKSFISSLTI